MKTKPTKPADKLDTLLPAQSYSLSIQKKRVSDSDWLLTYTDLVTLLITLFIIMVAHASFEKPGNGMIPLIFNNGQSLESIKSKFGDKEFLQTGDVIYLGDFPDTDDMMSITDKSGNLGQSLRQKQAKQINDAIEAAGISDGITVNVTEDNIEVRIESSILFETGKADYMASGKNILQTIVPSLIQNDMNIIVEGHTDNVPIHNDEFSSNWALASMRAIAVLEFLEDSDIPSSRLSAVSYADTRPIADNKTFEGRAKNRRVQLTLK